MSDSFTYRTNGDLELRLRNPLLALTRSCETECVAGCCGLDAFSFTSQNIAGWVREHPLSETWEALDQLAGVRYIVSLHRRQIVSDADEFNAWWETYWQCLGFLDNWRSLILEAIETVTGRRLVIDPSWLTTTVVDLARGICKERAFDRLSILADALQEAGCNNDDMLAHCRGPGPHARGCWVIDLVLGKE